MGLDRLVSEEVFNYRETKDHKLMISYENREVMILKGQKAASLSAKLARADAETRQLLLAKATGDFKRGNEQSSNRKQ